MSIGLIALLDDIAAIAKVAAASLDDVVTQAAKAGVKAAGVVIDDTAVTPRYVLGFAAERELPIVGKIAAGSLRNKLLLLLPATLALSYFLPWMITPLLMFGGAYLCYEGAEKVLEAIMPHQAHAHEAQLGTVALNPQTLEDEKVASAIKTDFILSAEIMAITLAAVPDGSIFMQALVLAFVGIGITVAVYGVVALIVKADDVGVALAKNDRRLGYWRYKPRIRTCSCSRYARLPDISPRRRHGRHDLGWWRHYCAWSGGVRPAFLWPSHQLRCRSSCSRAAVRRRSGEVDSCRRPIGGRWTVNRRGVDPSGRICLRTRMETVEGYFGRAPRMSLRLQTADVRFWG